MFQYNICCHNRCGQYPSIYLWAGLLSLNTVVKVIIVADDLGYGGLSCYGVTVIFSSNVKYNQKIASCPLLTIFASMADFF